MNQGQIDTEIKKAVQAPAIEDMLRSMRERAQRAVDAIDQLRNDKNELAGRIHHLEAEIASCKSEIVSKDQELKRLKTEYAQMLQSNGAKAFSPEEREDIKGKIRDLISKINSYL